MPQLSTILVQSTKEQFKAEIHRSKERRRLESSCDVFVSYSSVAMVTCECRALRDDAVTHALHAHAADVIGAEREGTSGDWQAAVLHLYRVAPCNKQACDVSGV